jgi:hypothetical protein
VQEIIIHVIHHAIRDTTLEVRQSGVNVRHILEMADPARSLNGILQSESGLGAAAIYTDNSDVIFRYFPQIMRTCHSANNGGSHVDKAAR